MILAAISMLLVQSDRVIVTPSTPVVRPTTPQSLIETLHVRITSTEGVLWQGPIRVSKSQGANYQQSLGQASVDSCPPDSGYDRSERRQISFNIYPQHSQRGPQYRVDVSWARPVLDSTCGESGTRTVQINQTVLLEAGATQTIEGDAGLRVEISRR